MATYIHTYIHAYTHMQTYIWEGTTMAVRSRNAQRRRCDKSRRPRASCGWVQSPLPYGAVAPAALRCAALASTRVAASLRPLSRGAGQISGGACLPTPLSSLAPCGDPPAVPRPRPPLSTSNRHHGRAAQGRFLDAARLPPSPPPQRARAPGPSMHALTGTSPSLRCPPSPPMLMPMPAHIAHSSPQNLRPTHRRTQSTPLSPFGCATAALPCRLRMLPRAPALWS